MQLLLLSPNMTESNAYQSYDKDNKTVESILQCFRHSLWEQGYYPEAKFEQYLNWFVCSVIINVDKPEILCVGRVKDLDYGMPKLTGDYDKN